MAHRTRAPRRHCRQGRQDHQPAAKRNPDVSTRCAATGPCRKELVECAPLFGAEKRSAAVGEFAARRTRPIEERDGRASRRACGGCRRNGAPEHELAEEGSPRRSSDCQSRARRARPGIPVAGGMRRSRQSSEVIVNAMTAYPGPRAPRAVAATIAWCCREPTLPQGGAGIHPMLFRDIKNGRRSKFAAEGRGS